MSTSYYYMAAVTENNYVPHVQWISIRRGRAEVRQLGWGALLANRDLLQTLHVGWHHIHSDDHPLLVDLIECL